MFTGVHARALGRTAVLGVGSVRIFICERPRSRMTRACSPAVSIRPRPLYVLLKSRQHFRAGFGPFAGRNGAGQRAGRHAARTTACSVQTAEPPHVPRWMPTPPWRMAKLDTRRC